MIFRTVVQQLTRFQLTKASRGPSAIAELLVCSSDRNAIFVDVKDSFTALTLREMVHGFVDKSDQS